jgi:hypothetical protein
MSNHLPFVFYNMNNESMRIDSNGNVGIGTSTVGCNVTIKKIEPEPLYTWYKKSVEQKGLKPHTRNENGKT